MLVATCVGAVVVVVVLLVLMFVFLSISDISVQSKTTTKKQCEILHQNIFMHRKIYSNKHFIYYRKIGHIIGMWQFFLIYCNLNKTATTGKSLEIPLKWGYLFVTCSNEMSRMSANLISRKHRINMQRWISTILTFCHQSILWYLFCQLAMLIFRLYYYYLVHFITFLDTLRNISSMNFVKQNR